jgi:pantothenate kinase
MNNSIQSPQFKNHNSIRVGLDIGGTLTKLSITIKKENELSDFLTKFDFFEKIELDKHFLYIKLLQTNRFDVEVIECLKGIREEYYFDEICATGGGAYKFHELVLKELNIKLDKHDELLSLVKGYIAMNHYNTFYEHINDGVVKDLPPEDLEHPHLAVNIGSGVSVLLVKSATEINRVSGTMMGGGTLIGLCKLLIQVDNYNDIMKLAKIGDNKNVDLIVKDIYGGGSNAFGLDDNIVASSFGKIHELLVLNKKDAIRKEDVAKSLLSMICFHIGQLAYLMSKQYNINKYI